MRRTLLSIALTLPLISMGQSAVMVKDIHPDNPGGNSSIWRMAELNGSVYFRANDVTHGSELWRANSSTGAEMVADAVPGTGSLYPDWFATFQNQLYFQAYKPSTGAELYRCDGVNPPQLVADLRAGINGSNPSGLFVFNDKLYFQASPTSTRLYEYNGVDAPSVVPGYTGVGFYNPTIYNGKLYFGGQTGGITEIFEFDGVNPPVQITTGAQWDDGVGEIIGYNGKLYYSYKTSAEGAELWSYDGVNAPSLVEDLYPGTIGSTPRSFAVVANKLYYDASDVTGRHLFTIDQNDPPVKELDLNPGGSMGFAYPTVADGVMYFKATDGVNSFQIWKYDGINPPVRMTNINPTSYSGVDSYFLTVIGDDVFFRANDGIHGDELWMASETGLDFVQQSVEASCADAANLCVPLHYIGTSIEVVSLDFTLTYDPAEMTFTGNASLAEGANPDHFNVMAFETTPGVVKGAVFLKPGAPIDAGFTGPSDVVCVEFSTTQDVGVPMSYAYTEVASGVLGQGLEDQFITGDGSVVLVNDEVTLRLKYAGIGNANRLIGENPAATPITVHQVAPDCSNPSSGVVPSIVGDVTFQFDDPSTATIQVVRDIDNTTPVIAAINGGDVNAAIEIALGITASPATASLLSADVDMDGRVSAYDASLISWRSSMAIGEFPSGRDWLWLTADQMANPPYSTATAQSVPAIDQCVDVSYMFDAGCVDPADLQTVAGILLGDVNLTWRNNNEAATLKTAAEYAVNLHLDHAAVDEHNLIHVPVSFSSNQVVRDVNLDVVYDNTQLQLVDAQLVTQDAQVDLFWNNYNGNHLLGGVRSLNGLEQETMLAELVFESTSGQVDESQFSHAVSYLNEAQVAIDLVPALNTGEATLSATAVGVYPNPTSGQVQVTLAGAEATAGYLVDAMGRIMQSFPLQAGVNEVQLDGLTPGVYFLHVQNVANKVVIK